MRTTLGCFALAALAGCGDAPASGDGVDDASTDGTIADATADGTAYDGPAYDASGDASGKVDAAPDASRDGGADASGDDASTSDGGSCAPVTAAADVDAWTMRAPSAGFGGIVTQSSLLTGTDVFLKSPTDLIRIGARLKWGGSVVFFGLSANPASNVIDANDTGRELQLALYDPTRALQGCAFNASCGDGGTACPTAQTYLGWDPVQGGDECNHGATVISYGQVGDALELVVRPLQWNPDWDAPDCRTTACGASGVPVDVVFRSQFRFVREHVVEVMSEVVSQETFSHPPAGQEFPTLYVSRGSGGPDLPLLLDADGQAHALSTAAGGGFYYDNFTSSAPWVTWQSSDQSYGVGLAQDQGLRGFQGWRGDGTTGPYFHNVRSIIGFGLAAKGMVRGLSYLALGNFATVKGEIEATLAARAPFGTVDAPAGGAVYHHGGKPIPVAGWVLDTAKIGEVKVEIDGAPAGTIQVTAARPDVCAVYPAYDGCPNVGFSEEIPSAGLDTCDHLLRVIAKDSDGNARVLGERVVAP